MKIADKPVLTDLGDKSIRIRKVVLEAFQNSFLDKAYAIEEAAKARHQRRQQSMSVINTVLGRGLTVAEDLEILREAQAKKDAENERTRVRKELATQRRAFAKANMLCDEHDAKVILFRCRNMQGRADKQLSVKHYKALLHGLGRYISHTHTSHTHPTLPDSTHTPTGQRI